MQLGFVIDQSRCIGCHACTVACKAENHVPLGSFRTWVKYVESGEFPVVRRSFAVLRCNQCTAAPCVEICPVAALSKRSDGIVDVDPRFCIGCKACMQACPYDALYLNESTGTAQKCHFCAHRAELGLAPACAVVCPTEAIVPGDFHDPASAVARLKAGGNLSARKLEAGTGPNVLYKEADAAAIDPMAASAAGGYLWSNRMPGLQRDAEQFEALENRARARTVYDVDQPAYWGRLVSACLFAKSLAAGVFLAGAPLALALSWAGRASRALAVAVPCLALLFLAATAAILVCDLARPARSFLVLTHANQRSWLHKGALVLLGYATTISLWLAFALLSLPLDRAQGTIAAGATGVLAALSAAYSAWLFAQAKGRVLWMRRGLALHLVVQALVAGDALFLVLSPALPEVPAGVLRWGLASSLALHLALTLLAPRLAPRGREGEYERAERLVSHGPFARAHWVFGVGAGILLPLAVSIVTSEPWVLAGAGAAALAGLFVEEDILVRAGQALPTS
ncbi:MAG: 4Fe-4S dicluster domain-containing protein [Planctomycetes bacterium]|nr:4Fe-4S dicluster domain-containing protein [Planctomycetota bacterium]